MRDCPACGRALPVDHPAHLFRKLTKAEFLLLCAIYEAGPAGISLHALQNKFRFRTGSVKVLISHLRRKLMEVESDFVITYPGTTETKTYILRKVK